MTNLFKKAACFTDLHLGLRNGSRIHNNDCTEFVNWFCETAKQEGAETCIFLGDWHNNRSTTDVSTMNYTVRNLETLNRSFERVYMLMGNHDEYYKDKRDIHSLEYAKLYPNIEIINHPFTQGDVTILPWLVGDEWKSVNKIKSKYVFGHFELPSFMMNALVQMPDHGQLQSNHFVNQDYVFSGHFHKRQINGKIVYIGNAFPHNYADTHDDDRGMMLLEWGGVPEFRTWPNQPVFRTYKLSQVVSDPDNLLKPRMNARVSIDVPISYEEANFVRETLIPQYELRELMLVPEKVEITTSEAIVGATFESVDTIVMNQIDSIDSDTYNKSLLLEIYNRL